MSGSGCRSLRDRGVPVPLRRADDDLAPKKMMNKRNAACSTGPRTGDGKSRSSQNALKHGLGSLVPILPGEQVKEWRASHDSIVHSLAPAPGFEQFLAERVAFCAWRLQRVARYEMAVTALGMQPAREAAPAPPDPADVQPDRGAALHAQLAEARAPTQRGPVRSGRMGGD